MIVGGVPSIFTVTVAVPPSEPLTSIDMGSVGETRRREWRQVRQLRPAVDRHIEGRSRARNRDLRWRREPARGGRRRSQGDGRRGRRWRRRRESRALVRCPRDVAGTVDHLHDDSDLLVGDPGGNCQGADERTGAGAEIEAQPISAGLIERHSTMNARGIAGTDRHIRERVARRALQHDLADLRRDPIGRVRVVDVARHSVVQHLGSNDRRDRRVPWR